MRPIGAAAAQWAPGVSGSRAEPERVVLEGFHPLKHALRFGAMVEDVLVADPAEVDALAARLAPDVMDALGRLPMRIVSRAELARVAGGRSHGSPDVVAYVRRPAADVDALLRGDTGPIVLLEQPTHLGNVGAVIRVAAAAGASAVLTSGALDPWHPAALRGAAGLHFALHCVARLEDFAAVFDAGRPIVAADPEGDASLGVLPERALLALGSERRGLSADVLARAHAHVRIPMRAGVSSLNLATAAAILLYVGR
jgi:TrmH family RNA methyltransferase